MVGYMALNHGILVRIQAPQLRTEDRFSAKGGPASGGESKPRSFGQKIGSPPKADPAPEDALASGEASGGESKPRSKAQFCALLREIQHCISLRQKQKQDLPQAGIELYPPKKKL